MGSSILYAFNPLVSGANVYLYKGINAINHIATYTYVGNGVVKNVITGTLIQPSQTKTSVTGYVSFTGLASGSYSVVVDISNLDTGHKVSDWNLDSINVPEPLSGNTIDFVFDIWPYSVTDIGL